MIKEGDMAPEFSLPIETGENLSLDDFKGKTTVLFFYPKDDTSGCTKEAIQFTELYEEFTKLGAQVFGISPDSVASHVKFRDKHNLTVSLLSDEEKDVIKEYGVWVQKNMYGRKYMGVERATFLIDADGKIVKVWRKVKVPRHAEAVLAAIKELAS